MKRIKNLPERIYAIYDPNKEKLVSSLTSKSRMFWLRKKACQDVLSECQKRNPPWVKNANDLEMVAFRLVRCKDVDTKDAVDEDWDN